MPTLAIGDMAPDFQGLTDQDQTIKLSDFRGQRVVVGVVALLVAVNVGLAGLRSLVGGEPGGPVSSSFSTGADGLEGYADLLRAVEGGHLDDGLDTVVVEDEREEEEEDRLHLRPLQVAVHERLLARRGCRPR